MTAIVRTDDSVPDPRLDTNAQAAERRGPPPNIEKTDAAIGGRRARAIDLNVLAVLAVLYTLYFAREFLLPIVYAILLNFLLSPVVRWLARFRIKPPIGSALVILAILGVLGSGAFKLSSAVREWAETAPATLVTAEQKLGKYIRPLQRASKTAEQVANAAGAATGATPPATKTAQVVVQGPSLASRAFGTTQRSVATILEVLILLYFLLAAGDLFLQKLVKVLPNLGDKLKAVNIARAIESSISTYLFTATSVNVVEGIVVSGVMYLWGMPNPAVWGSLVAILEFIPYLGALAMVVILAVAALTTFDSIGRTLLIPASFLAINLIQGNIVSPLLLGHRLSLNPVALFIGLAFWFWIWGVSGAFIAVPLLAMLKIFCDHIESLAAVGEFLGQRDDSERRTTLRSTPARV
ncbi:MAG: AI-2E family transporter [Gemmatimonadaceae bacterium]